MKTELADLLKRYASEDTNAFRGFTRLEVNTVGNESLTPLHVACTRGDERDVEILLHGGADVNARTDIGHTPLHCAVYERNAEIVRLLMAAGADPQAVSDFDETPLHIAKELGLQEIEGLMRPLKGV